MSLPDTDPLATLTRERDLVLRRVGGASPGSPDWDAAMDHLEELDRAIERATASPSIARDRLS